MKKQSLNSLKDYARYRLLDEMIQTVKANAGDPLGYYVLVMDQKAVKVISSICKMYDILSYRISTIERLDIGRKRFPGTDAIYLISPSESSINDLVNDFKDSATPQYKFAHIFLLGPLPEIFLGKIASSPELLQRIKTFKEVNVNYFVKETEVFHFGYEANLNILTSADISPTLTVQAERLMTVCSTFMENPYIQFLGKSPTCKALAIQLQQKMDELIKKASSEWKPHEPRGTIIIVDRGYDLNSPITHDFCYQALVYDLLKVRADGAVDPDNPTIPWKADEEKAAPKIEEEKKGGGEKKPPEEKKKYLFLTETNPQWKEYRHMHIGEVLQKLGEDTERLVKSNEKAGKLLSKAPDLDKLQEVISEMPNLKEMMRSHQCHNKIASECAKQVQLREYLNLIKLEQGIISGLEPTGEELDNRKVAAAIGKLLMDFKAIQEDDILRIYLMYLANYDVPKRDIETLAKSLTNPDLKDILYKLPLLGYGKAGADLKKPQRREGRLKKEDFDLFKLRNDKSKFADLLCLPKVAKVALGSQNRTLSVEEFPFLGDIPDDYKKKQPKSPSIALKKAISGMSLFSEEKSTQDIGSNPRLFIFVIGGICYQEITSIYKLQKEKFITCPVTVGGDCIITPKDFIASLQKIGKVALKIDSP